jgi:hypothetical protein
MKTHQSADQLHQSERLIATASILLIVVFTLLFWTHVAICFIVFIAGKDQHQPPTHAAGNDTRGGYPGNAGVHPGNVP